MSPIWPVFQPRTFTHVTKPTAHYLPMAGIRPQVTHATGVTPRHPTLTATITGPPDQHVNRVPSEPPTESTPHSMVIMRLRLLHPTSHFLSFGKQLAEKHLSPVPVCVGLVAKVVCQPVLDTSSVCVENSWNTCSPCSRRASLEGPSTYTGQLFLAF